MRALTHSMFTLLRCQEKPSGVYKMQETAWAAGAPNPAGGAYSASPDPLARWPRLSPPPNFHPPPNYNPSYGGRPLNDLVGG